jgi:3-dehydrosphinganine reductase
MKSFRNVHAIVTGGSSGIGRATSEALARRGARLSLVARGASRLAEAAAAIEAAGGTVCTASVDVADPSAMTAAMATLVEANGPCDILITSAGLAQPGHVAELDDAVYREQMDVNYFGTLHAVRAVLPSMIERRTGSIVTVSSAAGLIGIFGYTAYTPTKFAVRGYSECLRAELRPYGIHVGCVFPPDVDTPQLAYENKFKPAETKAISGTIKPLSADRVAEAIVAGIEKERFWIIPDRTTRLLARGGGLLRGVLTSSFDRKVTAVRRHAAPAGGEGLSRP